MHERPPGGQLAYAAPGGAVDGAGTEEADRLLVGGGRVALVAIEPVPRIAAVQVEQDHQTARDFFSLLDAANRLDGIRFKLKCFENIGNV